MDEPEVVNSLEDVGLVDASGYVPNRHTVSLKDGIDMSALLSGNETEFQVESGEEDDEDKAYFDGEEIFKQINSEFYCDSDSDDDDESEGPFDRFRKKMTDISGNGKVLKMVKREGTGPVIPDGAIARVHYNGYFEYKDEPFDSTYLRRKPHQFKLGEGAVVGFDLAVRSMRKDEKSWFLVHWEYAYGQLGAFPRVPEEANIMFVIELLSFVDSKAVDDFSSFTEEERRNASFEQILEVAHEERLAGNDFYRSNQVPKAITKFYKAIQLLENHNLKNEYEERKMNSELRDLCLNMSLCCLKQRQSPRAIKYARKALGIDPGNVKGLFRLGQAYMQLSEFDTARNWLMKAQKRSPNDADITRELSKLDRLVQKFRSIERDMCARMFGQSLTPKPGKKEEGLKPADSGKKVKDDQLEIMRDQLREFQKEEELTELPFPVTLTEIERKSVSEMAKEMGLYPDVRETKNKQLQLRIRKRPPLDTANEASNQ